jgi:import inner membrane translocase subunit TIM23
METNHHCSSPYQEHVWSIHNPTPSSQRTKQIHVYRPAPLAARGASCRVNPKSQPVARLTMSRSITQCVSHLRQANPTRALTSSSHNVRTSQRQRCSESVSVGIRHASSASPAATSTSPSTSAKELVTWNRFFELRQTRRWTNVAASGVSTVAAISIAGPIIATSDLIMNVAQSAGLQDPIMAIGLPTIAMGGVGWLAGPLLGNLVFSMRVGKDSLKDMAAVGSLCCFFRRRSS